MRHDGLLEHSGFYLSIITQPVADGWLAWATFERVRDFDKQESVVRAVRHRVKGIFESRGSAAAAARAYGIEAIDAGAVTL
jgi:hypothetical protein